MNEGIVFEEEIWKDIKEFRGVNYEEDQYQISNLGRVRRLTGNQYGKMYPLKTPRIRKPGFDSGGYLYVSLYKNNQIQNALIHRLVALHFIQNSKPEEYKYVDHIDGIKTNNSISNLRWCDQHSNNLNSKKRLDNTSGGKGVSKHRDKWRARINVNGKQVYIGLFRTKEEAIQARQEAEKKYYNEDFYISDRKK